MAKKAVGEIKLQIAAGQASPSPPVGPAKPAADREQTLLRDAFLAEEHAWLR